MNVSLYFHINVVKNQIFYVGIGKGRRAYSKRMRNKHWHNTVKKYKGYVVDIVEEGLTWEEACEKEKHYIQLIGRRDLGKGTLVNMTDGGEGTQNLANRISFFKGKSHSEEAKEKNRIAHLGKKQSKETIEKKRLGRQYLVGTGALNHSEETKSKIGIASGKSRLGKPRGKYKTKK